MTAGCAVHALDRLLIGLAAQLERLVMHRQHELQLRKALRQVADRGAGGAKRRTEALPPMGREDDPPEPFGLLQ